MGLVEGEVEEAFVNVVGESGSVPPSGGRRTVALVGSREVEQHLHLDSDNYYDWICEIVIHRAVSIPIKSMFPSLIFRDSLLSEI